MQEPAFTMHIYIYSITISINTDDDGHADWSKVHTRRYSLDDDEEEDEVAAAA